MRVIIVGAGRTGMQLARRLVQEKHDVTLIESNEERARHASNRLDCMVLHDEGNSLTALQEAGIAKAEALVCVTDSDEVNMIICGLAASKYPELSKTARVRNNDYVRLNQNARNKGILRDSSGKRSAVLGIDYFVHPDIETAKAVLRSLSHGAMGNILDFAGTSYELGSIKVVEGSSFDGMCLIDYHSIVSVDSLITLVEKEDASSVECFFPTGTTVLEKGDRIHILAPEAQMEQIFRHAGYNEKPLRHIGIVGGGHIGALIAEEILESEKGEKKKTGLFSMYSSLMSKSSRQVLIIEQNYQICKELSARFPEALILNEDISDESFVAEERIGDLDLIITATTNQELNIIAAIYLKSLGVRRAIAMVNGSGHVKIARQLGVDVVIPMQTVLVDSILSNLMDRSIREVHSLGDGEQEIFETEIREDSPAAEKPITEFKLSKGGLIMLVNREKTSFIPRGDYIFKAGDKLIFIAKSGSEAELVKFFDSPKGREA